MIVFTTDIATDKLLLAYNNNVVEFYSDNVILPTKAIVSIGSSTKTLFPAPNGKFYLNFKEWITSLINTDNYKDNISFEIDLAYDWTSKVYLNELITFTITLVNNDTETISRDVKFISSFLQVEDYKLKFPISNSLTNPVVLSPYENRSNQSCFIKYWEGYPIDLTIYTGSSNNIRIENLTNLTFNNFEIEGIVSRIALDNGDTNLTIENLLPIMTGFNNLKVTSNELDYFIELEKISDNCDGHYFKWVNELGGWSYWLFPFGNRNRRTRDLGELNNDFNNLDITTSPTVQLGKTSNDTIQLTSDVVNEKESIVLNSIIDSPKIYLFTGQPFAKANFNDWLEVSLTTSDIRIVNAKEKLNRFNLTFELPQRNTRKI